MMPSATFVKCPECHRTVDGTGPTCPKCAVPLDDAETVKTAHKDVGGDYGPL